MVLACLLAGCSAALKNSGSHWQVAALDNVVFKKLNGQKGNLGQAGDMLRDNVQIFDILIVNRVICCLIAENFQCKALENSRL